MAAPANDNFANATAISNFTGSATGTNISATVETSELGWPTFNPAPVYPVANATLAAQATVWFSWTCPAFAAPPSVGIYSYGAPSDGEMLFQLDANFKGVVQVFTAFGAEIASYIFDERVGRNGGAGNGAQCSFDAVTGTTYYIRVGGRQNAQGNFTLSWKPFDRFTLGACNQCGPTSEGAQIGSLTVPNVAADSTQSFPSVGGGLYKINYCKGVAIVDNGPVPYWALSAGTVGPGFSQTLLFTWPEGTWQPEPAGTSAPVMYNSQTQAELANNCLSSGYFVSCGGTFTMEWQDLLLADNQSGYSNPTFELIDASNNFGTDFFQTNIGATSLTGTSPSWSCTFGITSILPEAITGITATLLNIDGISSASAAQTITVSPGTGNTVTFTFDSVLGDQFTTATIELSACGAVFATLEYPLYPTIVLSLGTTDGGGFGCSPSGLNAFFTVKITSPIVSMADLGISGVVVTGTCSPLQLQSSDGHCTNVSSVSTTALGIGTHTDVLIMVVKTQGTTTNNTYTLSISCASLVYPNFTDVIAIP